MAGDSTTQDTGHELPQIRGYKLLRVIGHGGMSTVYLAEQESLGRKVAVKVMLPEALADEVGRRRFENEARTIARLDHPHIVDIFEVGRTLDGLPYYAMPYLPRGHLGTRIARHGRLDEARTLVILRALLDALDYAHVRGVVHRDVKAENVLFDDAERPQLADFGIALRRGSNPRVTSAGLAVGSTAYMPPEQARGEEVDSRADLYSVGVLAWEMLTGELPYKAGDALSMAMQHAQKPIPRLPVRLRHWQPFMDKALAKQPQSRFRSAQQMLEALEQIERGAFTPGALLAGLARAGERLRRLPYWAWATGVVLTLTVVAWAVIWAPSEEDGFFRIATPDDAAPAALPPAEDPIEKMLRPPPESPAQRWISAAERQLAARRLIAPADDNAVASAVEAWRADPQHERMDETLAAVMQALGEQMARRLREGDAARARDYLVRARELAAQTAPLGPPLLAKLRPQAAQALAARVADAERRAAREQALAAAALAEEFAGDAALARSLRARAEKIAQPGQRIADDPAGTVVARVGERTLAAMPRPVTRGEYARFAQATGRPAALCRERLSLLRVVAPRDWRNPGFALTDAGPAVCVSWADAEAYARWFSSTSGREYRLPSGAERRALPPLASAGRAVAEWTSDCAPGCRQRYAAGSSWRGASGARALDPARGYDDVGFRLVREL